MVLSPKRQATLEALAEIFATGDVTGCFDSARAEALLLSQSSPEELRAAGVSEVVIDAIWGAHAG